jgi:uncharacterized SAM-binding protein YcdF (DUF218 family)
MNPSSLFKEFPFPGSYVFFLVVIAFGAVLLYRKKDGGRAGRLLITLMVLAYWILSTPLTAVALVSLCSPAYPPVERREQAHGASAIVVLGSGMYVWRSRGDFFETSTPEDALRMMEAARVYRVLDRPWVIVTGGYGSPRHTEAARMASELTALGVPADRIVEEPQSANTHDHGIFVPPLLRERQVGQFVLVTSRQHISRALRVFRRAGLDPVPSSPEVYVNDSRPWGYYVPSQNALYVSEQLIYDQLGMVYYWARGWI